MKEIGFHLRFSSTLLVVARIRPGCPAKFPGVVTPSRPDAKLQPLVVAMEAFRCPRGRKADGFSRTRISDSPARE